MEGMEDRPSIEGYRQSLRRQSRRPSYVFDIKSYFQPATGLLPAVEGHDGQKNLPAAIFWAATGKLLAIGKRQIRLRAGANGDGGDDAPYVGHGDRGHRAAHGGHHGHVHRC